MRISGGEPTPTVPCPECDFPIQMTIDALLTRDRFRCAGCGLVLHLKREQSRQAMKALQGLKIAAERIESLRKKPF